MNVVAVNFIADYADTIVVFIVVNLVVNPAQNVVVVVVVVDVVDYRKSYISLFIFSRWLKHFFYFIFSHIFIFKTRNAG